MAEGHNLPWMLAVSRRRRSSCDRDGKNYRQCDDEPPLPGMSEKTLARMADVRAAWERGDPDM